jgi:GntR family transcriptional regulator
LVSVETTTASGLPRYVQIRESLRTEIAKGAFKPGQKLLPEDELASQYGVSRMTVRQALTDLIDAGIVYRRHGVGTFVSQAHVERDHSRLTNFFEAAEEEGIIARASVLVGEVIPAKRQVAIALNLEESEPVIRIKTLRFANDVPVTVHDAHIPYKLFPDLLKRNFERLHIWTHMEDYGYRVKRAVQKIEARDADEEMAQLLGIEIGGPILYKERTVYAEDGTPVEFTYCYNRGDTYSLTIVLSR